ncbi:MAG: PAS domain-containing sensor histidine kinase [Oceanospirillaceae bacterium]|nr:PAS domain-containing sensor histidine kinase [Oceanospirillaceae bacterium]MBT13432.1 PAS domain-containing sensor histidine kinase [Oceanospirillaceae bacterium]|tara:strand:- start:23246 stop:24556 length:1311 start_codon:yes stop_codon:yes gene_type:complete
MSPVWRRELRRISYLLIIAFVIGYTSGYHGWTIAAVLTLYLGWHMLQLSRLYRWLAAGQTAHLPATYGIWGSVFAETQRLQNRSMKHQQRLQAIINRIQDSTAALQDAVLMVDSQGNLEWWNQAAQRFLGLKAPVDVGQPITNLIRDPAFKSYFNQGEYADPFTMTSPVNKRIHLQFNITQFGRRDRLMLVHDVTRLKQLEQMRKDFVANVSHELRTPLTVLSGYIETMVTHADMLPERWGRMLDQMSSQSLRMEAIIKDLLTLSRLETSAKEQASPVAVQPLLEQIAADARALSLDRGHTIDLTLDGPVALLGYADELRSAFSNLAFNAVKYTPDNGHIELIWRTTAATSETPQAEFCVKDDGVGIAEHHIPRLTERFYRADPSRSKETGGTGLGLAIVKHVLLRHDGELVIDSTPGKGSCFCCRFSQQRTVNEL